jgi:cytochrome c-type protein NapC/trimethylamine-N-oxide reductase cytochrome c-type subunit TorC
MKKILKPALLVVSGIILGGFFFMVANIAMLATSTPDFCSACHEIRPAYFEWQTSSHASNEKGVVAECIDCHLPAPEQTLKFFYSKTYHGLKDVIGHYTGGEYDRTENRKHAAANMANSNCLSCHKNILYIAGKRGAMLAHKSVLYPRAGYEKKCTDCHENLVHNKSPVFAYAKEKY